MSELAELRDYVRFPSVSAQPQHAPDMKACGEWLQSFPGTDSQQLRALIRQARKDAPAQSAATVSQGLAPRQSRAYREIFQLVRAEMSSAEENGTDALEHNDDN
mgnify:CR=1 FL=1